MGIPCVTADSTTVKQLQELIAVNPQVAVTVNLETMQIQCSDFSAPVSIGEGAKYVCFRHLGCLRSISSPRRSSSGDGGEITVLELE